MSLLHVIPPFFRTLRAFYHLVFLPLVAGLCLVGCGSAQSRSASIISDLNLVEASVERTTTTLIHLRESKPGSDYLAMAKSLANEHDTMKKRVASVAQQSPDIEDLVSQANRQLYFLDHPPATPGQDNAAERAAVVQRADALRKAISGLAESRSEVNNLSDNYLKNIFAVVRDLAQQLESGYIPNRKIRLASTVDIGDTLLAELSTTTKHLKEVSDLLVTPP